MNCQWALILPVRSRLNDSERFLVRRSKRECQRALF